jgi:DtxR family Mn-dependent transcriptional regulator
MPKSAALSESLGDYLETIYHLVQTEKVARVRDIARRMRVRMPSVTGAVKALAKRGLVDHAPYSFVTLTGKGRKAAREIVRRHRIFAEFFEKVLGVDGEAAERNACHMEHVIEPEVLERLAAFLNSMTRGRAPAGGAK